MALVLFFGRPGSGKTYSAMADYILPAQQQGRRILHNIAGFKGGVAFGDAPIFPDVNIKPDNTIEFIHSPDDDNPARVRGGDMVVIDEFYLTRRGHRGTRSRPSAWENKFHDFLRAHRHYIGGGHACDIILMAQTDHDIEDAIKLCAERMHIMKTNILDPREVRRLDYDGGHQRMAGAKGDNCIAQTSFRPKPEVYRLYQSYTGDVAAKERIRGFSFWRIYKNVIRAGAGVFLAFAFAFFIGITKVIPVFTGGGDEPPSAPKPKAAGAVQISAERLPPSRVCVLRLDGDCFYDRIKQ